MFVPLLALGAASGITLILLLVWTRLRPALRFWPTPRPWSWQGIVFWSLFRILNLGAIAVSLLDWHDWTGLSPDRLAGVALALAGAALYGVAVHALGRGNLYCGKEGLVTGGVYGWTRNPQYAAAIPAYLGLALASQSLAALALAMLLALTFVLMALAEEPWLESAYGEEYRAYRQRVARFYNWRRGLALLTAAQARKRAAASFAAFPVRHERSATQHSSRAP